MSFTYKELDPILFTVLTTAERDAIAAPPDPLLIYNSTDQELQLHVGDGDWLALASIFGSKAEGNLFTWDAGNVALKALAELTDALHGNRGSGLHGDSHVAITVSGAPTYITLSGQDIVRGLVVLTTDVSGILPIANIDGVALRTDAAKTLLAAITLGAGGKLDANGTTGEIVVQGGTAAPTHDAPVDTVFVDHTNKKFYIKHAAGAEGGNWEEIAGGGGGAVKHNFVWYLHGDSVVADEQGPVHEVKEALTISTVDISAGNAPAGFAYIIDIETATARTGAWTTIFSTKAEIDIAAQVEDGNHVLSDTALAAGDFIRLNVDQVGNGGAPINVTVTLGCTT